MNRIARIALLMSLLAIALLGCGGGAPKVDWTIEITGAVSNPMSLTYKDLIKRDQVTLGDVLMQKSQGEDTVNSWEGPALAPILDEAGISDGAVAILVTADDGYAREIAMADLDDSIIALKLDGEWTDDEHGPVRIVVPNRPANHWLFRLVSIEVIE